MLFLVPVISYATSHEEEIAAGVAQAGSAPSAAEADIVSFPSVYFERFQPITALDMVQQVPGFQLEESRDGPRGFADATGNLLINDRRPSAKQDLPSDILSRIPAGNVERIELVRGQVRGIDLRGQTEMVNIILREESPAAVQWEASFLKNFKHGPLKPSLDVSLSNNWRGTEYNVGISIFKNSFGRRGQDLLLDGNGILTETRMDNRENRSSNYKGNINTVSQLGNRTIVKFNTIYSLQGRKQFLVSDRIPEDSLLDPREAIFDDEFDTPVLETGLDIEHKLKDDFIGKGIIIYSHSDEDSIKSQSIFDTDGNQTLNRVADGSSVSDELITRLEFDWTGIENHTLQANFERAFNKLDNSLEQTSDTGSGPVIVDIPGANSIVKEERWDFLVQDTWFLGELEVDYGLGAETSTIKQSGDAEQKRSFFFLKPQAVLNYAPEQQHQTRLRVAREVSQLDLTEFVSATVFEDDDLALGNPDIRPETTWVTEFSHERRFGDFSVVTVRVFHHWISNVLDLLPLTPDFEVPGNIGNGRRWGIELESSLPLDWLGLRSSKFDIKARLQDSTVVDPVTGENRILSGPEGDFPITYDVENTYAITLDYRQDFQASKISWGWNIITRDDRPRFKVNELEVFDEELQLGFFIESTRWFGVKVRLSSSNLLNSSGSRDRTVFVDERDLSPVEFQEFRDRTRGGSLDLTISGVF